MEAAPPPPIGPTDAGAAELRSALNEALADLSDDEFRDLTERVKRVFARRAAAAQARPLVDAQVRPELSKLTKRLRRDVGLRGRFAAGRPRTGRVSAHD